MSTEIEVKRWEKPKLKFVYSGCKILTTCSFTAPFEKVDFSIFAKETLNSYNKYSQQNDPISKTIIRSPHHSRSFTVNRFFDVNTQLALVHFRTIQSRNLSDLHSNVISNVQYFVVGISSDHLCKCERVYSKWQTQFISSPWLHRFVCVGFSEKSANRANILLFYRCDTFIVSIEYFAFDNVLFVICVLWAVWRLFFPFPNICCWHISVSEAQMFIYIFARVCWKSKLSVEPFKRNAPRCVCWYFTTAHSVDRCGIAHRERNGAKGRA